MSSAARRIADGVDRRIGESVSAAVRTHHRRRLEGLGKAALLSQSGGWAADSPPRRAGNRLEVLIDGEAALDRMVEELSQATTSVYLSGWFLSPDFVLRNGTAPVVARNLLAELAARIDLRVLLWAGAPLPVFRPSRREVRRVRYVSRAGFAWAPYR